MFHRVAVAYGYGTVLCRLEIYGYAVRRADFILTAVTLADGTREIVRGGEFFAHFRVDFVRFIRQTFLQRQHGAFVRRKRGMQVQYHADVVLFFIHHFLVVSVR